jgi:RHS repeat-associated protein
MHRLSRWAYARWQSARALLAPRLRSGAIVLMLITIVSANFATPFISATGFISVAYAQTGGSQGTPNRFNPRADATSVTHPAPNTAGPTAGTPPPGTMQRTFPVSMQPGALSLHIGQAAHFIGSDGILQVDVPAGAVTSSDLAQAQGGALTLQITQVLPASGSNAGGSGHVSFGTYLLQLVDGAGHPLGHGLHQPVTLTLHYGKHGSAVDVAHAVVVFNSGLPRGSAAETAARSTLGSPRTQPAALNSGAGTLSVQTMLTSASTSVSFNTNAPVASFGEPDPFNVNLNAGALTFSQPIDVPTGPGGLAPPVTLSYSSERVSEQHNIQAAAPWVGEGWNLSLGSVSWAEHNVTQCSGCSPEWESSWQLNDPFGTAAELIPPNINVSTYYDDTPNVYYNNSNGTYPNEPIQWHTDVESHARIYSYVGPNSLPNVPAKVSCFRVFLPNGIMEEFGCTPDSIEYYFVPSNLNSYYIANWFLDLITDPQGNQIHVTYQRDMETFSGASYTRDVVPATVEWDSPGCHNAQSACTGSAWAPLMRVNFAASHSPTRLTGHPTGNSCNTGSNLRCDDPKDLSGSGGLPAPQVQNTFVLNDMQVQVRSSGSAAWNTLRDYQLSYEQSGPGTITDPVSGLSESFAGTLDLTQLQEVGDAGQSALLYSGNDTSSTTSHAYMKLFDLSSQNIVVGPNTVLSYWIYPQNSASAPAPVSGSNSTCVAIDMIFTDGSDLRDSGAVDQNGNQLHPAHQCGHLKLNQWNLVTSDIGARVSGKTINRIDVGYDQPANTGGYRGYLDDITLSNPDSSTPLFSSGFESGDPQPTWRNTVDTGPGAGGNIVNVGGICCGLSGPESWAGSQVTAHWGSTTLPPRTFSYTSGTQHYEDTAFKATPSTNCGFSWNLNCWLWSRSLDGNSRYISSASNGLGLSQSFTWAEGRNNTHGDGSDAGNTLYCDSQTSSNSACNIADDENWSHMVLTSQSASVIRPSSGGNVTVTSTTSYQYRLTTPIASPPCSDCVASMYWGNQNDADQLDFYNAKFQGYTQVTVTNPDGSVEVHKFYATNGWGIYDTSQVKCFTSSPCHNDPWWAPGNALHGHEYEADFYDTDGKTLLKQVKTQYQLTCPPSGVSATPASSSWGNWDGHRVSMLDHNNPVAVCDIQTSQVDTYTFEGASSSLAVPHQTTTFVYDSYGRQTSATTTSNDGGAIGSPTTIVSKTSYIWNDAISAKQNGVSGIYIINAVAFSDTEDASGNRAACEYTSYDGGSYATGQQSALTLGNVTRVDRYTDCGSASNNFTPSGQISVTTAYDTSGNIVATTDPDANAGDTSHLGCTVGSTRYSLCFSYDSTFAALPVSLTNALGQQVVTAFTTSAGGGFGLWPTSSTDPNGQVTKATYDPLGRPTSTTLPGETSGLTTTTTTYTDWCSGTSAQTPCLEVDTTQRLDDATTVTSRAFYDGWGHLVETRTPAPNNQDVIQYAFYDPMGRVVFLSNKYFVPAYSGGPGASAFATPDASQPGTSTTYTNLRSTTVKDALSFASTTTTSVVCGVAGDSVCYVMTAQVDPLGHQRATYQDAFGAEVYAQSFTGNSQSTYAVYATISYGYDLQGNLVKIIAANGTSTATATYDDAGRQIGMTDPDRGSQSYSYDADGNLIKFVDARGSAGTIFIGYDALDRQIWRNTTNSPNGAYVTESYDSTANGNQGIGHLTSETFTGGPNNSLSGSRSFVYDGRGRLTSQSLTVGGVSYTVHTSYGDANQVLSLTYPDGQVVTNNYTNEGWLGGLITKQGANTTTLLSQVSYTGSGGAAGLMTGAFLNGCGCQYSASFDLLLRQTDGKLARTSDNLTLFDQTRTFDAAGNITGMTTTLPQGTDTQVFCYDEQGRLTWAGSMGTPPCTGTAITPGTLTAAQYAQSFTYDNLDRMTSGPLGSYTYGDPAHLHAVTSIGSSYTASYDAAGRMVCRSTTGSTTCAGSAPTGEQFSYDNEGHLIGWQNAQSNPTAETANLYDAEGHLVEEQATTGGTTTTTVFVGDLEEIATTGNATTTTVYYYANGQRVAMAVNGVISCMVSDASGSTTLVVDAGGNPNACQLYTPYGQPRYLCGVLPTDYGYAGEHTDAVTGLTHDSKGRSYDPGTGQFTSAAGGDGAESNGYLRLFPVEGSGIAGGGAGTGQSEGTEGSGTAHARVMIPEDPGVTQNPVPDLPSAGLILLPLLILPFDSDDWWEIVFPIIIFIISLIPAPIPPVPPVPPGHAIVQPQHPQQANQPTNPETPPPGKTFDPTTPQFPSGNRRFRRQGNQNEGGKTKKKGRNPPTPVPPTGPAKGKHGVGGSNNSSGGSTSGGSNRGGGGCFNTGVGNIGCFDSGSFNIGNFDSGSFNVGNFDSGNFNVGNFDRGNYNIGDFDSGNFNVGNFDSGNFNVGDFDSGNFNVGDFDSGNFNVGNFDSGSFDIGSHDSGSFDIGSYDSGWYDLGNNHACWFDFC